jgi:hypothetical protein
VTARPLWCVQGLRDASGALLADPRSYDVGEMALQAGGSAAVVAGVVEVLNMCFASHELTSEHVDAVLNHILADV